MIPRILHQIFFLGENAVPEEYRRYRDTWLKLHPEWAYRFWDETRANAFMEQHYPWFFPQYRAYGHWIQRCDALRYFLLHHEGGLYADMDIECLRPVDELLQHHDLVLSRLLAGVSNAIMGSRAGHPFWPQVFEALRLNHRAQRQSRLPWRHESFGVYVGNTTGPRMLSACVEQAKLEQDPSVKHLPSELFEPFAPRMENNRVLISEDVSRSYGIHHMSNGWLPTQARLLTKLMHQPAKLFWKVVQPPETLPKR